MPLDLYSMVGYLVVHNEFGPGKIVGAEGRNIDVYISAKEGVMKFGKAAIEQNAFSRSILYPGALVKSQQGVCAVTQFLNPRSENAYEYSVIYEESGLTARISELDLYPLSSEKTDTLIGKLIQGRPSEFKQFASRESLLISTSRLNRQVGGMQALLSSRIEVFPHQAYVTGLVIEDPIRRYILADEVGLGKTIEAGIILQDILSKDPGSKVLILAPSPLTRQWLSELHSSFGSGKDFKLADLRPNAADEIHNWNKVICSTELAIEHISHQIIKCDWDLIIVDEVHHLLEQPLLYEFVKTLSQNGSDLLLLSAIPVRKREGELYKLLALLEPETFTPDKISEHVFMELYDAQRTIGRRMRLVRRDLEDYANDRAEKSDVLNRIERLISLDIMSGDDQLKELVVSAHLPQTELQNVCEEVLQYISDNYRLNRRVLRNRRSRLIAEENIEAIERRLSHNKISVSDFELEANKDLIEFLSDLNQKIPQIFRPVFLSFTRVIFQSSIDSDLCLGFLEKFYTAKPCELTDIEREIVTSVASFNSDQARRHLDLLTAATKKYADPERISALISSFTVWKQYDEENARWRALIELLREERENGHKTLIFAGFPGLAEKLHEMLVHEFSNECVSKFLFSQDEFEKEENVRDFRDSAKKQFMICDESGGEGRNFQFANSVVHADLPFLPSLVEQRIGRLDRLGRDQAMSNVISHVLTSSDAVDAYYLRFLNEGLKSFTTTISGLEFALRNLQDQFIDELLEQRDGITNFFESVADVVENERYRDESDDLLDEASFNSRIASVYTSAGRYNDEDLPALFIEHFKNLSLQPNRAVSGSGNQIWSFKPDDIPLGTLDIKGTDETSEFGIRKGTFSRTIAQSRRDIEFFSYGNPLFDAVLKSLNSKQVGRSYAISCQTADPVTFAGIEFNIVPRISLPNALPLYYQARLQTQLRYTPNWNYVSLNPDINFSNRDVHEIRKHTTKSLQAYRDLNVHQLRLLESTEGTTLEDCIQRINEQRLPLIEQKLRARIEDFITLESEALDVKNKQLRRISDTNSLKELDHNLLYLDAIKNWFIEFDSIGVLVINR